MLQAGGQAVAVAVADDFACKVVFDPVAARVVPAIAVRCLPDEVVVLVLKDAGGDPRVVGVAADDALYAAVEVVICDGEGNPVEVGIPHAFEVAVFDDDLAVLDLEGQFGLARLVDGLVAG